jgi:hypothetical protein
MPSSLIRQVADYCWSNNFLDVFHKFFKDHADAFVGAPEMTGGEHNMEYYALFQLYLEVYESTLTDYLMTLDKNVEDFYAEVRECQDESMDPYLKTFVDCLLASADYESFYKVMVREGKKKATQIKKMEILKAAEDKGDAPVSPTSEGKGLSLQNPDEKSSSRDDGNYDADAKDGSPRNSPVRDDDAKGGDFK